MTPDLLLPIALLFVSIAVITGLGASAVLARNAPERRRLREMAYAGPATESLQLDRSGLVERLDPNNPGAGWLARASLPYARGDMGAWGSGSFENDTAMDWAASIASQRAWLRPCLVIRP